MSLRFILPILFHHHQDCKSYYHECFLRGRPELTKMMERLVNPGKRLPDKSGEPDFYEISKSFPLPDAPPVPPSDTSLEWKAPEASLPPIMHHRHPGSQSMVFSSSLPPNAGGYNNMYGYLHAAPHRPMLSPTKSANQEHNFSEQPQQMYWQNPVESTAFQQPPPPPYGYYQYPMMMPQMVAGPQGYYMVQQPFPPQATMMHNQYFPPAPSGVKPARPVATSSAGDLDSVFKPEVSENKAKPLGSIVTPLSASDAAAARSKELATPTAQTESNGGSKEQNNDNEVSV